MVILISGSGRGAGKTTLARRLVETYAVHSIADVMRYELDEKYPQYDWYCRDQNYKDTTYVKEFDCSVREVLISYGEEKRKKDPRYWVKKCVAAMISELSEGYSAVVDDVRYMEELEALKEAFPNAIHFHVHADRAISEKCDNDELFDAADYVLSWERE